MTKEELAAAGDELFGMHWRREFIYRLAISDDTLRRWETGESTIPGPAVAAIQCWRKCRKHTAR